MIFPVLLHGLETPAFEFTYVRDAPATVRGCVGLKLRDPD